MACETAMTTPARAATYPRPAPAAKRRCPRCKRTIWTAFDGSVCALHVDVDPVALDPVAEMLALLAGCRTVELHPDGRLIRRDARQIAAGQPRPVLATHQCGRTNIGKPLTNPIPKPPAIHIGDDDDIPPF